jgi:hypothetical protein
MKKIYFHIIFLILFVLFTFFTYRISSCNSMLPGDCGSIVSVLIRLLSTLVIILSFLIYLGYAFACFFQKESRFLKLTMYMLMFSYGILFIAEIILDKYYWLYNDIIDLLSGKHSVY